MCLLGFVCRLEKQNSSLPETETSGLSPTKTDEDAIVAQEISKNGCDSDATSNSETESEGNFNLFFSVYFMSWYLI